MTGCRLNRPLSFLHILLISILLSIYSSPPLNAEVREIHKEGITVLYYIRFFQPGEAFLIEVKSPKTIQTIDATLFGRGISFYEDGGSLTRYAVGGIDLHTKPGDTLRLEDILSVKEKVFKTHKITVDRGYVVLNNKNTKRVGREQKKIKDVFNAVDAERLWEGNFTMPLPDTSITSSFGGRRIINGKPRKPHPGVDLKAKEGTRIYASNRGRVSIAEDIYFSGKTVILDHGMGVYTIYAHLSSIEVKTGQLVKKGETVGLVGATGRVTGPHLHWGVKVMGTAVVDPLSLKSLPLK
ncbi:MAG: M23 family metallopeptidase [Thermodesulfobacteriota bacterium]